jgi:hypothetical protein
VTDSPSIIYCELCARSGANECQAEGVFSLALCAADLRDRTPGESWRPTGEFERRHRRIRRPDRASHLARGSILKKVSTARPVLYLLGVPLIGTTAGMRAPLATNPRDLRELQSGIAVDNCGCGRQERGAHDKRHQLATSRPWFIEEPLIDTTADMRNVLATNPGWGSHDPPSIAELIRLGFR